MSSYPAPGADIFSKLGKGSVVVLHQGAGNPQVEDDSTSEVILAVAGFSALTNTGRLLCCVDSTLIDVTPAVLGDGKYEIAPEAQELLARAEAVESDD